MVKQTADLSTTVTTYGYHIRYQSRNPKNNSFPRHESAKLAVRNLGQGEESAFFWRLKLCGLES